MPRKKRAVHRRRAELPPEFATLLLAGTVAGPLAELLERAVGADGVKALWLRRLRARAEFWPVTLGLPAEFRGEPDQVASLWREHRDALLNFYIAEHGDTPATRSAFRARERQVLTAEQEFIPVRAAWDAAREVAVRAEKAGTTPTAWRAACAAEGRAP